MMHSFNRFMNTRYASAHTAEASCACANSTRSNIALILDTMIMVSIFAIISILGLILNLRGLILITLILGLLILGKVNTYEQHISA